MYLLTDTKLKSPLPMSFLLLSLNNFIVFKLYSVSWKPANHSVSEWYSM